MVSIGLALFTFLSSTTASAALWTSEPKGAWECNRNDNGCVAHTGFRPNAGSGPYGPWWGQARNPKGNCTAYAAYRLIKNDASKPDGPRGIAGGAGAWRRRVIEDPDLGPGHVNQRPAVGSIAWWSSGHVAYVEKVVKGTVYISDSNWGTGSKRYKTRDGKRGWPDAFLHVRDAPGGRSGSNNPRGHLDKVSSPAPGQVRVVGWAYDPDKKKDPVPIRVYVGGKAGSNGAERYEIGPANRKRERYLSRTFKGAGAKHGFDKTFRTGKRGKQQVCVYAINLGSGSSVLLGCKKVSLGSRQSEDESISSPVDPNSGLAVTETSSGSTKVFSVRPDGQLANTYYKDGSWHYGTLPGTAGAGSDLAVTATDNGSKVFFVKPDGGLANTYYKDGDWLTGSLPGTASTSSGLAVTETSSGSTKVFFVRPDGQLANIYYKDGDWHAGTLPGIATAGSALAVSATDNGSKVFFVRPDGGLEAIHYEGGNWLAESVPGIAMVTSDLAITETSQGPKVFFVGPDSLLANTYYQDGNLLTAVVR
jgi:surface antigen